MKRSELAHILRAACDVTNDPEILVIGSQAILASFSEDELPGDATLSIEADVAFPDDPDEQDYRFAQALLAARLVHADVLFARAELIPGPQAIKRRVLRWIEGAESRL